MDVEDDILRDTHKITTNSLYVYNRVRNVMRDSIKTAYNEIDPLPLYEKINTGPYIIFIILVKVLMLHLICFTHIFLNYN